MWRGRDTHNTLYKTSATESLGLQNQTHRHTAGKTEKWYHLHRNLVNTQEIFKCTFPFTEQSYLIGIFYRRIVGQIIKLLRCKGIHCGIICNSKSLETIQMLIWALVK